MTAPLAAPGTHIPVLVHEAVSWLITDPSGIYVDTTFGCGGHTRALAQQLELDAILVGLDQDAPLLEAFDRTGLTQQLKLVHANFENLDQALKQEKIDRVTGILFDLGLNSATLDDPTRGFSFDKNGPLDMRFDQSRPLTAAQVLNEYSEKALTNILYKYGEERSAPRLAQKIVRRRLSGEFLMTADLRAIVAELTPKKYLIKALSRVFQALRIEVNHELDALRQGLSKGLDQLRIGGRLAVISYHSLEDRIVKQFFKSEALIQAPPEQRVYRATVPGRIKILTRKPIRANADEITFNPRSRSAKLRVVERVA